MMGTVDRLLKATEDIWASYHEKPFVQGLKYGTLDQKKFQIGRASCRERV